MANKIQIRRDSAANWAAFNPILADGELGIDTTNGYMKFGDGLKPWTECQYVRFPGSSEPDQAPVNTAVPTISGTAQVGQTLTSTIGTWTGSPTPTYSRQWLRNGAAIAGATAASYVPTTDDIGAAISLRVTATNSEGSASATSASTAAVIAAGGGNVAPSNNSVPTISGTAQVGQTLTSTIGGWSGVPTPTYARRWLRDGAAISGATGASYALVTADLGAVISLRVTATNSEGTAQATSAATSAVVAAPADSRARFGYGSATAGVTSPEALLASMTVMTGSSNASKAGSFTSTVPDRPVRMGGLRGRRIGRSA
ncbi:MAG: hypothetical protein QM777_08915 [Pseudorhodoferax sp.]